MSLLEQGVWERSRSKGMGCKSEVWTGRSNRSSLRVIVDDLSDQYQHVQNRKGT